MKRILTAVCVLSLMLGASVASASQATGQCNANIGRQIGDAQQLIKGHQDCTNTVFNGIEFAQLGCFQLLFAGQLAANNLGATAANLLGTRICTASCFCFFPVGPGALQTACGGPALCP